MNLKCGTPDYDTNAWQTFIRGFLRDSHDTIVHEKRGVVYSYPNTFTMLKNNIVVVSKGTHTLKIVIFGWKPDGLPEGLLNLPELKGDGFRFRFYH